MTPLLDIALVAMAILGVTFTVARAIREWRRSDLADQAADEWDAAVTDALRLAAFGRHPVTQRPSVAGWWRAEYPRDRTHPILRLITEDK